MEPAVSAPDHKVVNIIVISVLFVVVATIFGGMGYVLGQRSVPPAPTVAIVKPSPSPTPTTYENPFDQTYVNPFQ